jgi:cyclophilin family peptidyl-prolyl cis-trans isomerase
MSYQIFFRPFLIVLFSGLLASCGSNIKSVTGITAPGLRYTGSFSIVSLNLTGEALVASGMQVYANGTKCSNDTSKSETNRTATCLIKVPNDLVVNVRVANASNDTIYTTSFTAPMPQVTFKTSMGDFVLELNPIKAPITVDNFLSYVNKSPSFYNGTIFHRVIAGFMVQGGGFTTGMTRVPDSNTGITNESNNGLTNDRGTVAMARTDISNSATSQFYVNVVDNPRLDYSSASSPGYAVFGKVVSGMGVIDHIAVQPTTTVNGSSDVPVTDITVTSATQTQ